MSDFNTFLWVAFPWLAIAAFVIGMIWRWRTDQFGWTTHSSQIYESKLLRLSSPLFHYGMLFVFKGWVPAWMRLQPTTMLIFITLEQLKNAVDWYRGDL